MGFTVTNHTKYIVSSAAKMNTEGEKQGFNDLKQTLRKVSTYILHKWKKIFQDLEIDGNDIENEDQFPRMSERIFERLCIWFINGGDISTKKHKLHSVLIDHGAKRGAEEMERYLTGKVITARQIICSYESKSKPKHKTKISMSLRRTGFQQKKTLRSVRCAKKKKTKSCIESMDKCEIALKIVAKDIRRNPDQTGDKQKTYQKMCIDFYSYIQKNHEFHEKLFEGLLGHPGISVTSVMSGSLYMHLNCVSLGAFATLAELNRTGRLPAICQTALVTEQVLTTVGASRFIVDVYIDPEVMMRAKKILFSRKCLEPTEPTIKRRIQIIETEFILNDMFINSNTYTDDVGSDKWLDEACAESNRIRQLYDIFEFSMADFIRILHIANPISGGEYKSLNDVIMCNKYLSKGGSLSNGLKPTLVHEYLTIVNSVRIVVGKLKKYYWQLLTARIIYETDLFEIEWILAELFLMLKPTYVFKSGECNMNRDLLALERTCTDLVCYVPCLVFKLSNLLTKLDKY